MSFVLAQEFIPPSRMIQMWHYAWSACAGAGYQAAQAQHIFTWPDRPIREAARVVISRRRTEGNAGATGLLICALVDRNFPSNAA